MRRNDAKINTYHKRHTLTSDTKFLFKITENVTEINVEEITDHEEEGRDNREKMTHPSSLTIILSL